jgi:hypothetical protein
MIDSNFVEAIKNLAGAEPIAVDGQEYATKAVFNPPLPVEPLTPCLTVSTLTGLVDFWNEKGDNSEPKAGQIFHVRNYHEVALLSAIQGVNRQRENFITANCGAPLFKFGQFMPHAEFMIGIQALFTDYGDRAKVMKVVGTIRDEAAKTSMDDGITQKVTASAGITLSQEVALPNPVMLKPYRTFSEIEQPPSSFVLRVQPGKGGMPDVALFEADGGRWKHEAILGIREYLTGKIEGITVIA